GPQLLAVEQAPDGEQRIIVAIPHALLHRDDGVVGDADVLGAHLGATTGDVAHAGAVVLLELRDAVLGVQRVHLQTGDADHEARTDELVLTLAVAQHVTHVLAQEALDALAELLRAIGVSLMHAALAVGPRRDRLERRDALVLAVVP